MEFIVYLEASCLDSVSLSLFCVSTMATSDPEKTSIRPKSLSISAENTTNETSPGASVKGIDDNYDLYKNAHGVEVDAVEAKRVLRKIDLRVMPILFVTYMLQYLDKNSINFSSVYGLQKGTNLGPGQYSWLGMLVL